ncbi:MAG: HEAT repeat domain-containing protein [Planctomycetaceae bacterium]
MKAFLKRINWNLVATVAVVVVAAVVLLRALDVGTRWDLSRSVSQLLRGEEPDKARRTLLAISNRAMVVEALKEALESEEGSVRGKLYVAQALLAEGAESGWNEPRPVYRALGSKVASTRRAAAFLLYARAGYQEASMAVAMEWLRDKSAPERSLAIQIVMTTKPPEVVPDLLEMMRQPARNAEEAQLVRMALSALGTFRPKGIAAEVLALAVDPKSEVDVRGQAFRLLGRLEDADAAATGEAMRTILLDRGAGAVIRNMVAGELRLKAYAGERTWEALERVLRAKDEAPSDEWIQRECLRSLGEHLPMDRLQALLRDRDVYGHRNYGVRSDTASAMAPMLQKDKVAFDILCEMLVDEEARDTKFTVRQEAWISLWMMTRRAFGAQDQQLFVKIPALPSEPRRENMFAFSLGRGIDDKQLAAIEALLPNLATMQRVRQSYIQEWSRIEEEWRAEAEQKAKADAEAARRAEEEKARAGD